MDYVNSTEPSLNTFNEVGKDGSEVLSVGIFGSERPER